jgi:amidase
MPAKPTIEQLCETAQMYGMHLSDADLESFADLMSAALESYRRIDQLTEPALPVRYPRSGGYRPAASENPLNAWYQKCSIKGASKRNAIQIINHSTTLRHAPANQYLRGCAGGNP